MKKFCISCKTFLTHANFCYYKFKTHLNLSLWQFTFILWKFHLFIGNIPPNIIFLSWELWDATDKCNNSSHSSSIFILQKDIKYQKGLTDFHWVILLFSGKARLETTSLNFQVKGIFLNTTIQVRVFVISLKDLVIKAGLSHLQK